jgi:hypothetical protein
MSCLAHFEAVIDFGDDDREDDVSDAAITALLPKVNAGQAHAVLLGRVSTSDRVHTPGITTEHCVLSLLWVPCDALWMCTDAC